MADSSDLTDLERSQIETELLRVWNRLEPYADWTPSSSRLPSGVDTPAEVEILKYWLSLFEEEIDVVRRGRNTVVHSLSAPTEQLRGALAAGNELWRLLGQRLRTTDQPKATEWLFQLHRTGRPWDKKADEVDWEESAVGEAVRFTAIRFGTGAWYAQGPVVIKAPEPLADPAWTVSSRIGETPLMSGRVGHALAEAEEFILPVTDAIVGGVPWWL
jgi:hypothetical protein